MRKNSIKNTRINTEVQSMLIVLASSRRIYPTRRHQGPESGADDFRGSGGSST